MDYCSAAPGPTLAQASPFSLEITSPSLPENSTRNSPSMISIQPRSKQTRVGTEKNNHATRYQIRGASSILSRCGFFSSLYIVKKESMSALTCIVSDLKKIKQMVNRRPGVLNI